MLRRFYAAARKTRGLWAALVFASVMPVAAGSAVIERDAPTLQRYGWPILGGALVALVEAILIIGLLAQRRQRTRAQAALARSLRFEQFVAETSTALARLSPAEMEAELPRALLRVATELGFDRASLLEFTDDLARAGITRSVAVAGSDPLSGRLRLERFPWTFAAVKRGELVQWPALSYIPAAASEDHKAFAALGIEGFVCVPLTRGGTVVGALSLATVGRSARWPATLIQRSQLLGEVFAHVIVGRRAESTIRESEERFRVMADSAPVMMWMADAEGRWTYFNRQWLQFTGQRLEAELGSGWAERVHPDDREQSLERYRRHFDAKEEFLLEYRLRRHDGEYRWLIDRGVPRLSREGAFRGYVGACSDITAIRLAHDTMLEAVSLRGAIFGSLYGHVAAVDRDGVILAVNEAWSTFLEDGGWDTIRPALGTDYVAACQRAAGAGNAGAQQAEKALRAVLERRTSRASCEYVARSGAEERWFEMTVEPFKRREGGAIISHIDITRRRRAEAEARREREELAHVLRVTTLSQMAASLAHEISQPLAAIVSNAQAARLMLAKRTVRDDDIEGALTDIANDAKRSAHVIRRLRALFRKEWAEQRRPINVNDLIVEVTALLQPELKPKGVAVKLLPGEPLPPVSGDAIQLQQVILNVVVNAAEAMDGAATEAATVSVATVHDPEGTVEIIIQDCGPGVRDEELERIFEPFVTTKKAGLGMGLSISRSIIQAHGGRIWATRNRERGLTIHIELPCEERGDQP